MELHFQAFKDVAEQEAYRTQRETLREVKTLKSQGKRGDRMIVQQIAHSRSEANLRHLNTTDLIKAESESTRRRTQELQDKVTKERKLDQARLEALFKISLKVEIKKILKAFLSSNERIDPHTNDSWYLRLLHWERLTRDSLAAALRGDRRDCQCFCFDE